MPSPFPGMDPFIESQAWDDFHLAAMVTMSEFLNAGTDGGFAARLERRPVPAPSSIRAWLRPPERYVSPEGPMLRFGGASGATTDPTDTHESTACHEEGRGRRRVRLNLLVAATREVVTVIEMLAPEDKRAEGRARLAYLHERDRILRSRVDFVEFDLLRGGTKMPFGIKNPAPGGYDYSAVQSRGWHKRSSALIAWSLRQEMPGIPIPFRDRFDLPLDLQAVLDTVYDRAHYDGILNYSAPLLPPPDAETARWIAELTGGKFTPPSAQAEPSKDPRP